MTTVTPRLGWLVALIVAVTGATLDVAAGETAYALSIPESDSVTYEIDIPVEFPGPLKVHAVWSGKRKVSLRLIPPDAIRSIRRVGLSPLTVEADVEPQAAGGRSWKLAIYALAARGAGEGLLTVRTPEATQLKIRYTDARPTPPRPTPRLEAWQLPRSTPETATKPVRRFFRAAEAYRGLVVEDSGAADACRWQDDLLRSLSEFQDEMAGTAPQLAEPARDLFKRMAAAVATVDELRTTRDPEIVGPPPDGAVRRENWRIDRLERIDQIEGDLDELMLAVQRGYAPTVSSAEWPGRMISCLTAAERHFEERTRVGENRAVNRDLAEAQWPNLLAAGAALKSLASAAEPSAGVITPRFRVR